MSIVERLRNGTDMPAPECWSDTLQWLYDITDEAADTIESLRRELEEAKREVKDYWSLELVIATNKLAAQSATIAKLRGLIGKLIAATPGHAGQCSGLKCREPYCYSCNDESEADDYLQSVWNLCAEANQALASTTDHEQVLRNGEEV